MRNCSAFSTRFGVSTQPLARGVLAQLRQQLPDEILHRRIVHRRSCGRPLARGHRRRRPRAGPRCAVRAARDLAERQRRRGDLAGAARAATRGLRVGVEAARAPATGSAATRPRRAHGAALERGMTAGAGRDASQPDRPEGHFWLAANMGALAESYGLRAGPEIPRRRSSDELEKVLRLDPAFQQGSADRALGRWYFKVPGLFGGSKKKSEEHLRKSLTYNPNSTVVALLPRRDARGLMAQGTTRSRSSSGSIEPVFEPRTGRPEDTEFKSTGARDARAADRIEVNSVPRRGPSWASCQRPNCWAAYAGLTASLLVLVTCLSFAVHGQSDSAVQKPVAPGGCAGADLLARMTLEEKVAQTLAVWQGRRGMLRGRRAESSIRSARAAVCRTASGRSRGSAGGATSREEAARRAGRWSSRTRCRSGCSSTRGSAFRR